MFFKYHNNTFCILKKTHTRIIVCIHILYFKWITQFISKIYLNRCLITKKIVLLIFLIQNDYNLLQEIGFNKNDINRLSIEFKNILLEQNEEYLDYIKNEEESILEKFLNK